MTEIKLSLAASESKQASHRQNAGSDVPFCASILSALSNLMKSFESFAVEGEQNVHVAIADLEFSVILVRFLAVDFCASNCWETIFEASLARTWYKIANTTIA